MIFLTPSFLSTQAHGNLGTRTKDEKIERPDPGRDIVPSPHRFEKRTLTKRLQIDAYKLTLQIAPSVGALVHARRPAT
jgi:hypothetical protein